MGGGWATSRAAQQRRDLLARSAATDGDRDSTDDSGVRPRRTVGRRHCWVVLDGEEPMPGVVAAWEQNHSGTWRARVVYVLDDDGAVMSGWLPAACLHSHRYGSSSGRASDR